MTEITLEDVLMDHAIKTKKAKRVLKVVEGAHPVDIHVGERLRLCRKLKGMSQTTLGTALGLTFQQTQKYERGANRMSASKLFEAARALDVPINYFFEGLEASATGASESAIETTVMKAYVVMPEITALPLLSREARVAIGTLIKELSQG